MAPDHARVSMDYARSSYRAGDGATFMNLYTADLMVREQTDDRHRSIAADRLIGAAAAPRVAGLGVRQRLSHAIAHARVLRQRHAV